MAAPSTSEEPSWRAFAVWLVNYFEVLAGESQTDAWHQGLATACEWLRLIDAGAVSPEDVSSLMSIAHANVYRGSGWHSMAIGIRS